MYKSHTFVLLDQASEQFGKRFEAAAQNMEQLINDVAAMRNQVHELTADVIHLKQRMAAIDKTNNNTVTDFSIPQTEQ